MRVAALAWPLGGSATTDIHSRKKVEMQRLLVPSNDGFADPASDHAHNLKGKQNPSLPVVLQATPFTRVSSRLVEQIG